MICFESFLRTNKNKWKRVFFLSERTFQSNFSKFSQFSNCFFCGGFGMKCFFLYPNLPKFDTNPPKVWWIFSDSRRKDLLNPSRRWMGFVVIVFMNWIELEDGQILHLHWFCYYMPWKEWEIESKEYNIFILIELFVFGMEVDSICMVVISYMDRKDDYLGDYSWELNDLGRCSIITVIASTQRIHSVILLYILCS